jgi:hypothetical protein
MKYLCLVYGEYSALRGLSEQDATALTEECLDYDDALRKSGHLIVAEALEPVAAAKTVRVRGGKPALTDGPFAETKEQLLGFIMIEAPNHADAIGVAVRSPMARLGSIEVRPVKELARQSPQDLAAPLLKQRQRQ